MTNSLETLPILQGYHPVDRKRSRVSDHKSVADPGFPDSRRQS